MLVRLLQPDPILLDDPVRPKISPQRKLGWGRYVYMWIEGKEIGAIVCTAHRYNIPKTERELFQTHKHEDTGLKVIGIIFLLKLVCLLNHAIEIGQ